MKKQKGKSISFVFDSYPGNFDREFVAYITGLLTSVQLSIDYEETKPHPAYGYNGKSTNEYRPQLSRKFWEEEFGLDACATDFYIEKVYNCSWDQTRIPFVEYIDASKLPEGYSVYKYLRHVFEEVDDWSEWTFHNIGWSKTRGVNNCDMLTIYLKDDVDDQTLELLKRRANAFSSIYETYDPRTGKPKFVSLLAII
jgi:hypothetical protein